MKEHQVVIVGGGPAGTGTARILAEGGIDTLVLERNKEVGKPVQCAGLISPRAYEMAGSPCPIKNEIKGGMVFSPGGNSIHIRSEDVKALVIDRVGFDDGMASKAREAGASLRCRTRVVEISRRNDHFLIDYQDDQGTGTIRSDYLVGADGAGSFVRERLAYPGPREVLLGYGTHGNGARIPPDEIVIITGEDVAPGFFAWIIPEGTEGRARVGLCVPSIKGSPAQYYGKLLSHPLALQYLGDYVEDFRVGGKIELGLLSRCVQGKSALVGDSAAMAKPISGGGIYPALSAAETLARSIIHDIENHGEGSSLAIYQRFVEREMKREIDMAMAGRQLYKKVSVDQMEKVFEMLSTKKVVDFFSRRGDIDHPMDMIPGLVMRVPKLATLGFSLLPSLLG